MITSYLHPGSKLGNQMFQSAAAIGLAEKFKDSFAITPWIRQQYFKHTLPLVPKNINFTMYEEPNFYYNEIPRIAQNIDLHGYFQSEKYFKHCEDKIRYYFEPSDYAIDYVKKKFPDLHDRVSIHVRSGDYIRYPNHHPLCSKEYYQKAVDQFPNSKFIVVSDDIFYCQEMFQIESTDDIIFSQENEIEDLTIQMLCRGNICANSSFSWWGSWLNQTPNKKAIMPKLWFGSALNKDPKWDTKDLYPEAEGTIIL